MWEAFIAWVELTLTASKTSVVSFLKSHCVYQYKIFILITGFIVLDSIPLWAIARDPKNIEATISRVQHFIKDTIKNTDTNIISESFHFRPQLTKMMTPITSTLIIPKLWAITSLTFREQNKPWQTFFFFTSYAARCRNRCITKVCFVLEIFIYWSTYINL